MDNGTMATWAAILTAAGGILGGIGVWVMNYLQKKHDLSKEKAILDRSIKKEERSDALAEWKEVTDKLQDRCDYLQTRADKFAEELSQCHRDHARATELLTDVKLENAALKGDVQLLQASVQRLQTVTGAVSVGDAPGIILADLHGLIKVVSPAIAPLLGWMPSDLEGRSVEAIVPERLREAHRAGLKRVRDSGATPLGDKALVTFALDKAGKERAVMIMLKGITDEGGKVAFISAEVKLRTAVAQAPEERS